MNLSSITQKQPLRIVFCGTPQFAVPSLKQIVEQPDFEVVGVITQPDRPRGRGMEVSFSAVKEVAVAAELTVHQPQKIRSSEAQELLQRLAPDCVAIIAYGQLIPEALLSIPRYGWINLHASLLPKYRGAAPINWAIVNGEMQSGVTTMRINAGMDTGDILLQQEIAIGPDETAPDIAARMAEQGASLMVETLRGLAVGEITARPQEHNQATLAPLLTKENGRIDWDFPALQIYNHIRGFAPWPGAYTTFRGRTLHLWGEPLAHSGFVEENLPPTGFMPHGTLLHLRKDVFVVCGGTTVLRLTAVKEEGRKRVSASEFVNGARLIEGERFGTA